MLRLPLWNAAGKFKQTRFTVELLTSIHCLSDSVGIQNQAIAGIKPCAECGALGYGEWTNGRAPVRLIGDTRSLRTQHRLIMAGLRILNLTGRRVVATKDHRHEQERFIIGIQQTIHLL